MAKLFLTLILIFGVWLLFPQNASAHLAGQPPFFKVNGVYSNLYPVPTTSLEDFTLPQDLAPGPYLLNQPISFEFDTSQLPVTPQALADTKFFWDFGDGNKGTGLKNNHTYTKMGSYMIVINAQYQTEIPQIIQSVLIHVVPDKNYQMPAAFIKVNNQMSKDPLTDILKFDFQKPIQFDASESRSKGSPIVSYTWDFGDRQKGSEARMEHQYDPKQIQVFPVLRIKDSNGFISDNFVEIENQQFQDSPSDQKINNKQPTTSSNSTSNLDRYKLPAAVGLILILLIVVYFIRKQRR